MSFDRLETALWALGSPTIVLKYHRKRWFVMIGSGKKTATAEGDSAESTLDVALNRLLKQKHIATAR